LRGGAYLGSYLKKKGENLATHEDVDKLVKQVAVVTETIKEIEAKISNDVWDRQRKWEMKRDALSEAGKDLGSMEDCLITFIVTVRSALQAPPEESKIWDQRIEEAVQLYNKCGASFSRSMPLATLVCGDEVRDKVGSVKHLIVSMFNLASDGKTQEASNMWAKYMDKLYELKVAIRNELSMTR
jgi:hypothetical protein